MATETKKTNWSIFCNYIDTHLEFTITELKALGIPNNSGEQHRYYLKRAGFIRSLGKGKYIRTKTIGEVSIYKVKEIGFDLELEAIN